MDAGIPLATLIIVPLVHCSMRRGPRGGRVDTGDAVYILPGARGFPGGGAASAEVRGLSPAAGEA
ncbi:hypothetical protein IPC744_19650 [Pseudomonas aeruginosa]|nr:hypothetical protein IPC1280_27210 [Pseudomonas aeruginosa]RPS00860.1 hypothetical protein IPC1020_25380 [Pseudomonas aeruginosa]RPW62975.1 hypothetical protein IPC744_19650 [Pseudomonas aeruginosa]RQI00666.1 hypothetical protein IPC97_00240 [Pseudomonas aeruginosa]RUJ60393.1 hypothetical protein IPC252_16850 [Pseudomonas aeruginosa]